MGRRLGPKVGDGEYVQTGNILVRQRGTKMRPGVDVGCGKDHTLYALSEGLAKFCRGAPKAGKVRGQVYVHIVPVPPHRENSVQRSISRMEARRYRGPILHAPR